MSETKNKENENKKAVTQEFKEEISNCKVNKKTNKKTTEIEELKNELNKKIDIESQQKESYLRLAAEYDNYRKRSERDRMNVCADAIADAIREILPVADSLLSASNINSENAKEYKKGLELVNEQLNSCLKKLGVEKFGKVGEDFDPNLHSAVSHVKDESFKENKIVEIFQVGYKINGRIIRHAMVRAAN
ncbi:MAG: nucleotide exchange factor GrpE [Oscillospiraceae bacterium]|nr:nucleotide exchange factor GrpE [Oscillospiraceae bacterium]